MPSIDPHSCAFLIKTSAAEMLAVGASCQHFRFVFYRFFIISKRGECVQHGRRFYLQDAASVNLSIKATSWLMQAWRRRIRRLQK